jgi:hypothetical protein
MSNRVKPDKMTYTVAELAALRGVCEATMIRWLKEGCCKFMIKDGRRIDDCLPGVKGIRIPKDEADAYLRKCTVVGTEQGAPATSPDSPARMDLPTAGVAGTDGVSRRRSKAARRLNRSV